MKKCSDCEEEKSFDDFYARARHKKYPNTPAGYDTRCKPCARAERTRFVRNNPQKIRNTALKMAYGIDLSVYNKMFENQMGCCLICNQHQSDLNKSLRVDHNHETGEVRGLLCSNCNVGIGMFKDNPKFLESAIKYLTKLKTELADENSNVVDISTKKVG